MTERIPPPIAQRKTVQSNLAQPPGIQLTASRAWLIGHPGEQRTSNIFPGAGGPGSSSREGLWCFSRGSDSLASVFETRMTSMWGPGRVTNGPGLLITEGDSGPWDFGF